jgi:hypothetical protein
MFSERFLSFTIILPLRFHSLWRNGMCGLEDHDCRARKQARQGRVRDNRTAEQPNNRISTRQMNIVYAHENKT